MKQNSSNLKNVSANSGTSNPLYYYLVKTQPQSDLQADYQSILDYLKSFTDLKLVQDSPASASFSFPESQRTASIKISLPDKIVISCEKGDGVTVNVLKNLIQNLNYRIYNPQTHSFLVQDPNLLDLSSTVIDPGHAQIFSLHQVLPLYQFRNSEVFYVRKPDSEIIYLANRHLVEYFLENQYRYIPENEFISPVADSLSQFIALFDRGLIPISFYETTNIYPNHLSNLPGINPNSLLQDMFITINAFDLDSSMQTFTQSTLFANRKDKLQKDSSLLDHITSLLPVISPKKIIATKIHRDIGFTPTSPTQIIPHLQVSIYLE